MTTDSTPARRRAKRTQLKDYGPQQFPDRLGLPRSVFDRAVRDGLIPAATAGRWPASTVESALANLAAIKAAVGSQSDVGAVRAAEVLSARFEIDVEPETLLELDRQGHIPQIGEHKGHILYDGRALGRFDDRAALLRAIRDGRLLNRDESTTHLEIRRSDFDHLVRSNWLEPVTWVHSSWQRRREQPAVALFRLGDLEVILAHPAIDWDEIRQTPSGRPSTLARISRGPTRRTQH
jgi:hypothetical protein